LRRWPLYLDSGNGDGVCQTPADLRLNINIIDPKRQRLMAG
jgi:hypothetical protein